MRYSGLWFFILGYFIRMLIRYINKRKYSQKVEPFRFFDHFSHELIRVEQFEKNGFDSLIPSNKMSIIAKDFYNLNGNWCFKYKWKAGSSKDKISLFVENWARENNISFDSKSEFVIRICSPNWHYPDHYDCVDNRMFIIQGNRKAIIDGRELFAQPGDMIFVPIGSNHEFWGDTEIVSIVVNIEDRPSNFEDCELNFEKDYNEQIERVNNKVENNRRR